MTDLGAERDTLPGVFAGSEQLGRIRLRKQRREQTDGGASCGPAARVGTDLAIIGAGAAGLMAGACAGELGIRAVVLERKHQPGRKLLMCGNNRCNLCHAGSPEEIIPAYGEPVGEFVAPALRSFPPARVREWFAAHSVPTVVHKDGRVFPRSGRADDVLHAFTDALRDCRVPLVLNCPVDDVEPAPGGWLVLTRNMAVRARYVLIATGGVSYPKTGSVGDGQKIAKRLGHRLNPYRAGLVGFELRETWLSKYADEAFPGAVLRIVCSDGQVAETRGEILLTRWGARGPSMVDASRIVARIGLRGYWFEADLCPGQTEAQLITDLRARAQASKRTTVGEWLAGTCIPERLVADFAAKVLGLQAGRGLDGSDRASLGRLARGLKCWRLEPVRPRPLKEAMVTVGGVTLDGVDPTTMESRPASGLFFAGEVLDIDGPTGGYNLQAAYATARLAVRVIQSRLDTEAGQPGAAVADR